MDVYQFAEYETRVIDGARPTPGDKRLALDLAARGGLVPRLDVDWLDGGQIKLTTYSWVGVVRFSAMEIRVVPKLVGGNLRVLQMIEYADDTRLIKRLPTDHTLPADGPNLFDLIVFLMTEETKALIRHGLIRDYHAVDDSLNLLRGRMRLREQFLRRYGQLHRIDCTFDEFDGDVPENQLLATALQVAAPRATDPDIRRGVRTVGAALGEVCDTSTRDADWYQRNITYRRRNRHYWSAHVLAKMVLQGLALRDHSGTSTVTLTAFMVDMNSLFERFTTRLVINSLAGSQLRARPQLSNSAVIINEQTGDTYSRIRPDLLIENTDTGHRVPVDVKYKLYDTANKISSTDIYQSFVYAYALAADSPCAGLIYPSTTSIQGPSLRVKPVTDATPARIRGAGIDVPAILDVIGNAGEDALHDRIRMVIREITGFPSDSEALATARP